MKKVLLVAVAGLFVLASCKKDRTCECTITSGSETYVDKDGTYKKVTKRFMKDQVGCVSYEYVSESGNITKSECEIK